MSTPALRRFFVCFLLVMFAAALPLPALASPQKNPSSGEFHSLGSWTDLLSAFFSKFWGGEAVYLERKIEPSITIPPGTVPPGVLRDEGADIDPSGKH